MTNKHFIYIFFLLIFLLCKNNKKIINNFKNKINKINKIFDKVFILNLDKDKKKLDSMKIKLNNYNINFERFSAINGKELKNIKLLRYGNEGAVGNKKSVIEMIKIAKKNNYKRILLLEDDLIFIKNFNKKFNLSYNELIKNNNNWNLLYFGASNRKKSNDKQKYFRKPHNSYGSFAVGIDNSVFDLILKYENDNRPIDDIMVEEIQKNKAFKTFVFNPMLITADQRKISSTDGVKWDEKFYYNLNNINMDDYNF